MALSNTERQQRYRKRIKSGQKRRFQLVLPVEAGIKVDQLCQALGCNKTELFLQLVEAEASKLGITTPASDRMEEQKQTGREGCNGGS